MGAKHEKLGNISGAILVILTLYLAAILIVSVRPKTPIFLETVWRDPSVLEIFGEEQQNLSKFDPEDFHEISRAMHIMIDSA